MSDENTENETAEQKEAEARKVDEILRRGNLREIVKHLPLLKHYLGDW